MFALTNTPAKLSSFNPRAEKHGDENVPACDLKFEISAHSSLLDALDKSYRPFLFRKPALGEQNDMLDELSVLDKPKLKPLKLDEEFPGYKLAIAKGSGLVEPMNLSEVELSTFEIKPIQGGSVSLSFSAACHPSEGQAGLLYTLVQNQCEITLEPPSIVDAPQGDILDAQERGEV